MNKKIKIITPIVLGSIVLTYTTDTSKALATNVRTQSNLAYKIKKPPINTRIKTSFSSGWKSFKSLFSSCFKSNKNPKEKFEMDVFSTEYATINQNFNDFKLPRVKLKSEYKINDEGNTIYTSPSSYSNKIVTTAQIEPKNNKDNKSLLNRIPLGYERPTPQVHIKNKKHVSFHPIVESAVYIPPKNPNDKDGKFKKSYINLSIVGDYD